MSCETCNCMATWKWKMLDNGRNTCVYCDNNLYTEDEYNKVSLICSTRCWNKNMYDTISDNYLQVEKRECINCGRRNFSSIPIDLVEIDREFAPPKEATSSIWPVHGRTSPLPFLHGAHYVCTFCNKNAASRECRLTRCGGCCLCPVHIHGGDIEEKTRFEKQMMRKRKRRKLHD